MDPDRDNPSLQNLIEQLKSYTNASNDLIQSFNQLLHKSDMEQRFSEPMAMIGVYIALASLFCILAMLADLLHGLRTKKLWFPCKYFTMNAASCFALAVAMKLPVDLNNPMEGIVDQCAKLGSMAFMCAMMANLLPALASMDNKGLIANIIGLGVLIITIVVNVCIQIKTGVVKDYSEFIATIYVAMLLILLIIHASTSLAILKCKQILELKYQAAHETALNDQELQQGRSTVEKLKQQLKTYWIMAETSNPQFLTACLVTSCASGVISVVSTLLHAFIMFHTVEYWMEFQSDYKWSMLVILIIQFIGSLVGTIAPLSRCFAALNFKLSLKWIWKKMKVFNVESYWTQSLYDLKGSSIPLTSYSRKFKILFQIEVLVLSFCVGLQKTAVAVCNMLSIILYFVLLCIYYCSCCWKCFKSMLSKYAFGIVLANNPEQHQSIGNFSNYILQIHEDTEFAEGTLKRISKSFDHNIRKAVEQQPYNLMKLLDESAQFGEVEKYYNFHHVPHLVLDEPLICWSLSLVTLASIAISLTNIQKNLVDDLMRGVKEGLVYVKFVEESLNATDDHASIQKAAKTLWVEVEVYHNWLGNELQRPAPQVNTVQQILQWFRDIANSMVTEVEITDDNSRYRFICSNSMYRVTETILRDYHTDIDQVSQESLFAKLSLLIADISAACLTNVPQVIKLKYHSRAIEKREASVFNAAQLIGETSVIINTLEDRGQLPS